MCVCIVQILCIQMAFLISTDDSEYEAVVIIQIAIKKYRNKSNDSDALYTAFSRPSFDVYITPKHCTMVLGHFLFTHPTICHICPSEHFAWLRWTRFLLCAVCGCSLVRYMLHKNENIMLFDRHKDAGGDAWLYSATKYSRRAVLRGVVKFSSHFPAIFLLAHYGVFFLQPWRLWKKHVSSRSSSLCYTV